MNEDIAITTRRGIISDPHLKMGHLSGVTHVCGLNYCYWPSKNDPPLVP